MLAEKSPSNERATLSVRPRFARITDAAAYLGLSRSKLYQQAKLGKLTLYRVGGRSVVEYSELDRFADAELAANQAA